MRSLSDDEDDDIEALRLAALESLKRKNQGNSQTHPPIDSVPAYPENNVIPNHSQPMFPPFPSNEMSFQSHPPREEMIYPQNNVGYPPEPLTPIPLHPVDSNQLPDFSYPPPVDIPPSFHPDGPRMIGPPPNHPFPPPLGPEGIFYPPPPGPGPMIRPMFNEMGAPMHPRPRFRKPGKLRKLGFPFRGPIHMRPRVPPPHVRLPPPSQIPHHNLITLTESQNLKKSDATDEKTEETPKENVEKPKKVVGDKDKIYNSLDLPQHRYCKVTAKPQESEEEKTEESSKFSRYEVEDSDSSESSEEEEKEEEEEEDPDVLNLLDDDEDDLDKLMEKMEKEMSGESKSSKTKGSKTPTKKAKQSSIVIYDTNDNKSTEAMNTDVKESKSTSSNGEIRIVKYCDNLQESEKELANFDDPSNVCSSSVNSKAKISENDDSLVVNSAPTSNLETRSITNLNSVENLKSNSCREKSKSPSNKKLSPGPSKTLLPASRSEFSPPPHVRSPGKASKAMSPNRNSALESVSPRHSRQYSPKRFRSRSRSPYYSRKSPVHLRKSPDFSPPLRRYSRSPSPRFSDHRRRSPSPRSPSYRSGLPVRSPSHRYPRYSPVESRARSPGPPGRRLVSPMRGRRSSSPSPRRYRSPNSPRSPLRRPLSPLRRLSPSRRPLSPSWRPVSPSRRPLSPNRRFPSPSRRSLSPIRRPLSPLRRPLSPNRRPLSPSRRTARRPLSPEKRLRRHPDSPLRRALSPGLRSPVRRFSPNRRSLSPGRRSLSPRRRPLSPGRKPLSPPRRPLSPGKRLSPLRRPTSPSRRPLSPLRRPSSPSRRPLSPLRRPLSPNRRPLSPGRKPVSPDKRSLSPARRLVSPRRSFSPNKRQFSPERRSHHPNRRPFSPSRRAMSPSRRPLSPSRRLVSPPRGHSPSRRSLSPSRRLRRCLRSKSPVDGASPNRRPVSRERSPGDNAVFSPTRRPGSPRLLRSHNRRNSPRRSPNSRRNVRKSLSPGFPANKTISSSRQRSRSPRWKKLEAEKRSTSPKDKRHRSPHSRKLDHKSSSASVSRSSPPKSDENASAKRTFDAREKILDRRKQNENKNKKSSCDNDSKGKSVPAEQLNPVLEARRRKFETNNVVKPVPKKIKLSSLSTTCQENLSGSADDSRKPLTAQNPHRVEFTGNLDEREFIPDFSQDQIPLSNIALSPEFQRSRIPSWAEPEEPLDSVEPTIRIKQEQDADAVQTNMCDFLEPNERLGELEPSLPAETMGELEEPALVINFDPMEINEPDVLNYKGGAQKSLADKLDLVPQQPGEVSDPASKPFIKLKPLTELLDRSTLKKALKVKKKEDSEEKIAKKKKKSKKHKVKDRESDEEVDLRNELKRRRAERMNQAGSVSESLSSRLVQSAFEGVVGKKRLKIKEEKPKKHKRTVKEEKVGKDRRRVLVISSSAKLHPQSSLSPVSDADEDDELGDEMMFRRAEESLEDKFAMRRGGGLASRSRRNVSRKQFPAPILKHYPWAKSYHVGSPLSPNLPCCGSVTPELFNVKCNESSLYSKWLNKLIKAV